MEFADVPTRDRFSNNGRCPSGTGRDALFETRYFFFGRLLGVYWL